MSDTSMGWVKHRVKHDDGRTGTIKREYCGFGYVELTLSVEGQAEPEQIRLNSSFRDSGAKGWKWMYARPQDAEAWGYLGDHNDREDGAAT